MKRRLIEHYEVIRKLGAGGSGVVYLANDTLLMRPVVLKILKRGALTIEQMRSTVLREARLASAIEHPNVCAIYEVGESEDEAYIVMQYVPGESLDKIIANGAGQRAAWAFRGHSDCGRPERGAPAGNFPSRSEARKRDADRWRGGQDSGLWPGPETLGRRGGVRSGQAAPGCVEDARCAPPTRHAAAPSPTWRRSSS